MGRLGRQPDSRFFHAGIFAVLLASGIGSCSAYDAFQPNLSFVRAPQKTSSAPKPSFFSKLPDFNEAYLKSLEKEDGEVAYAKGEIPVPGSVARLTGKDMLKLIDRSTGLEDSLKITQAETTTNAFLSKDPNGNLIIGYESENRSGLDARTKELIFAVHTRIANTGRVSFSEKELEVETCVLTKYRKRLDAETKFACSKNDTDYIPLGLSSKGIERLSGVNNRANITQKNAQTNGK
jgi:hypothetical protein